MTITVKLDSVLEARVRARLDDKMTLSDFVRRALIEKLDRDDHRPTPYDLWAQHFDGGSCEEADASERAGEIAAERARGKHRTR